MSEPIGGWRYFVEVSINLLDERVDLHVAQKSFIAQLEIPPCPIPPLGTVFFADGDGNDFELAGVRYWYHSKRTIHLVMKEIFLPASEADEYHAWVADLKNIGFVECR